MNRGQKILSDNKIGIFNHFLCRNGEKWSQQLENFDVKRVARDIYESGAKYYFLTIMQGSKYIISPNETYLKITGYENCDVTSERDLIKEIGEELAKYDIDLYLYFTGDGPHLDEKAGKAMGYYAPNGCWEPDGKGDYKLMDEIVQVTEQFVKNWASVMEEYSVKYKEYLKGWWIDGCYNYFGYNDSLLEIYRRAAKKGNPDCVVCFNNGVENAFSDWGSPDYVAGERNDLEYVPDRQLYGEALCHVLLPLGTKEGSVNQKKNQSDWRSKGLFFKKEDLLEYAKTVTGVGGAITFDIYIGEDSDFDREQLEAVKYISDNI